MAPLRMVETRHRGAPKRGTEMSGFRSLTEAEFLSRLRAQVGRRVRIWYDVDSSEGGAERETVEGRLVAVLSEVVLDESRLIHPSLVDDHARRTASLESIRGYNGLDPRTGEVTSTVVRPKSAVASP